MQHVDDIMVLKYVVFLKQNKGFEFYSDYYN